MGRMLDALAGDLAAIGTKVPPVEGRFEGAPVFSLAPKFRQVVHALGLKRQPCGARLSWRRVLEHARRPEVEVVLCNYATTAARLLPAWERIDKPVYVHVHGHDVTWDARRHDDPRRAHHPAEYLAQVRRLAERVRFIANSRHSAGLLAEIGAPADRIDVKYFGVPEETVSRCGGGPDITILYLGRLIGCKGPEATIQAFDLACRRGLKGRLVIAGDGPLRGRCEAARLGSPFAERISLLGTVDAAAGRQLRAEADVFTAHSQRGENGQVEAFGVAFVEAMAAGLPVVAGRSGGLKETVMHNHTGLLFEPGDVEQHASYLLHLEQDEQHRLALGAGARDRARTCFSLAQEKARLREILFGETPLRAAA